GYDFESYRLDVAADGSVRVSHAGEKRCPALDPCAFPVLARTRIPPGPAPGPVELTCGYFQSTHAE
ncbi:MAG: hypothetical protein HOO96_17520, partial [Polyangiaceae bacterium]|nr:hypothetical protein [Polyangiaceae bacterium]